MPSKFFYGTVLLGLALWFITKDVKVGLLPIILYIFIRIIVNLMLALTEAPGRV